MKLCVAEYSVYYHHHTMVEPDFFFVFFLFLIVRYSSQRAVTTALWCNFLVFSLKFGVWLATSSHVMLAEVVHSVADFANQVYSLIASLIYTIDNVRVSKSL